MKSYLVLFLALATTGLTAIAGETSVNVSVLDNVVLCVRASRVPEDVREQIRAATVPSHLSGTVLDLRFADDAAPNAADYFIRQKSPLVLLINGDTRGTAATLAIQLRNSADAVLIGSTNSSGELRPDIVVSVSTDDEKKFQDNPFFKTEDSPLPSLSGTNLLAFVDHTSEADLVRKRIKDGEQDGSLSTPRAEPPRPIVRDPALARAMDLLKALAVLHTARG
jgi:hypothetical protein